MHLSFLAITAIASATLISAAAIEKRAIAQTFSPASSSPTTQSSNYTGKSNSTLSNGPIVTGKSFDRFIQIWLENTDYATAASSPTFQKLAAQGLSLSAYYGVTHPSEPNYVAAVTGDFFGLGDDAFYALPTNVSSVVDLLEAKQVSWATYQENMPYDGFTGFNYSQSNYLTGNTSSSYVYYVRKHNPLIICDSVASVSERGMRVRNFNDFAADVNANTLPQWMFITPNLVNDAHDTNIDFTSAWLESFLVPLLNNTNFNTNRTLILLTFDESETYTINNQVYTLVLGGGLPSELVGKTDDNYYTHYSTLSTVQANWNTSSLGRGDCNKTMNNVFSWVANATGVSLNGLTANSSNLPLTNLTGVFPGPLNSEIWTPALAPPFINATSPTGGAVFLDSSVNKSLASYTPLNLTALNAINPSTLNPGYDYSTGKLVVLANPNASTTSTVASATATVLSGSATPSSSSLGPTTSKSTSGAERLVFSTSALIAAAIALAF